MTKTELITMSDYLFGDIIVVVPRLTTNKSRKKDKEDQDNRHCPIYFIPVCYKMVMKLPVSYKRVMELPLCYKRVMESCIEEKEILYNTIIHSKYHQ